MKTFSTTPSSGSIKLRKPERETETRADADQTTASCWSSTLVPNVMVLKNNFLQILEKWAKKNERTTLSPIDKILTVSIKICHMIFSVRLFPIFCIRSTSSIFAHLNVICRRSFRFVHSLNCMLRFSCDRVFFDDLFEW